jgi:hypothetical protein
MGLFSEKDEENDEDTFVPLKKPAEANKGQKKPLFGDDSDEESAKPAIS